MERHPEQHAIISQLISLIELACDVYVHRAINNVAAAATVELVEAFVKRAKSFDSTTPGNHVLVWAYFIMAAESSVKEHRDFLARRLQSIHGQTKFGNIPHALRLLSKLWSGGDKLRWTLSLPQSSNVFIM